jgi:flagellar biosynthesis protein FlhA
MRIKAFGGFTLAELLIALAILGVIATFTIPKIINAQQNQSYIAATKEVCATMANAYQQYQWNNTIDTSVFTLEQLIPSINYVAQVTDNTPVDNVVTASEGSLAKDLFAQVQSKPYGLLFAAGFLIVIAISGLFGTGLPWWTFLPIALILIGVAFSVFLANDVQQQLGQLDQVKENMSELINPNRMYEKLGVDPLSLQVGNDLLVIADPDQDGQLLGKIAGLRARMTDELGFILPNIRIMDSVQLGPNEYLVSIRGNPVATANVYPGRYMIAASQFQAHNLRPPKSAVISMEPTYGLEEAYWLAPQEIPEELQKSALDATDALIEHLKEVVIKHVDEVMTKMDVLKLMELVRQQDQSLIQEMIPSILTPNDLRKIFVNLVREKVSIKDIMFVFERLSDR